jgi:DNA invertase Pin-like site-specific DNA recombinase
MLASIAEFETQIRSERQKEGIAKVMENGVQFGRKAKLSDDQVNELRQKREQGVLIKDFMKAYGISKASAYRLITII